MKKIALATMSLAGLLAGSLAAGSALADSRTAVLQHDAAAVIQPGVGAKSASLDAGTQVTIVDVNGEWTHVQTASGVDGWIPTIALRQQGY
jgi:hypothetical protein